MIINKVASSNHRGFNAICNCDNCGKIITQKYSVVIRFKTHFCDINCKKIYCRGKNHPNYKKVMPEAQKIKISKSKKGTILSKETIEKIRQANSGKHPSKETKRKIGNAQLREKNHNWKNGRRKCKRGYVMLLKPEHPFATLKGYVMEHRILMEEMLGRYLEPGEVVHHINGITNDNRKENLMLFINQNMHIKHHQLLLRIT